MRFSAIIGNRKNLNRLSEAIANNRVPHAMLFTGPEGLGKRLAAVAVAAAMNCERPGAEGACGDCISCRMLAGGTHPSIRFIGSLKNEDTLLADFGKNGTVTINNTIPGTEESPRKTIKVNIDQIKEIIRESSLKSSGISSKKIFIIDDVALSSNEALNCLLKVLEEPPAETYFVLVTANDDMLLPTVKSRCQIVKFVPLSDVEMREFTAMKLDNGELDISDEQELADLINISDGIPGRLLHLASMDELYFENTLPGEFFDDVRKWYSSSADCLEKLKVLLKKEDLFFRNNPSQTGYERIMVIEETIDSIAKNANTDIAVSNMLIKLGQVDFGAVP